MTGDFEKWFRKNHPNERELYGLLFNAFRSGFLCGFERGREL